jgi:hypothetical protein
MIISLHRQRLVFTRILLRSVPQQLEVVRDGDVVHGLHLLHHWQLSSADLLLILMASAMPIPAMAEDRILNLTLVPPRCHSTDAGMDDARLLTSAAIRCY